MRKTTWIWIGVTQILILITSLIIYKQINLLTYTNVAFGYGAIQLLIALSGQVIKSQFFDAVFASFQKFFGNMNNEDRRPLSELIPQRLTNLLLSGVITTFLMIVTLVLYESMH